MGFLTERVVPKGDDITGWGKLGYDFTTNNTDDELAAAARIANAYDPTGELRFLSYLGLD